VSVKRFSFLGKDTRRRIAQELVAERERVRRRIVTITTKDLLGNGTQDAVMLELAHRAGEHEALEGLLRLLEAEE
jgi:hypothetical protein